MTLSDSLGGAVAAAVRVDLNNVPKTGLRLKSATIGELTRLGLSLVPGLRLILYDEDEPHNDLIAIVEVVHDARSGSWSLIPIQFTHEIDLGEEDREEYRRVKVPGAEPIA